LHSHCHIITWRTWLYLCQRCAV